MQPRACSNLYVDYATEAGHEIVERHNLVEILRDVLQVQTTSVQSACAALGKGQVRSGQQWGLQNFELDKLQVTSVRSSKPHTVNG